MTFSAVRSDTPPVTPLSPQVQIANLLHSTASAAASGFFDSARGNVLAAAAVAAAAAVEAGDPTDPGTDAALWGARVHLLLRVAEGCR